MNKSGSSARRRIALKHITQDLDMNDNRITDLGPPKYNSDAVTKKWVEYQLTDLDAVTKRWVTQQLKDGMKNIDDLESECNLLKMEMKRMQKEYNSSIKELTKKLIDVEGSKVGKLEYLSTKGGRMDGDLDMQGHAIRNLPEGTHADEPVTQGWYVKNWHDLTIDLKGRVSALEERVELHLSTNP